jgi:hypothetical protein
MMVNTRAARERIATQADELAAKTGDTRFAHAAGILRGQLAGRPPADDGAALAFAESLIEAGLAKSKNQACKRAATMYSPDRQKVNATRARLARKLPRNYFRP